MSSRQINFFITGTELRKFNVFLQKNNWKVVLGESVDGKAVVLNEIGDKPKNFTLFQFLVLESDLDKLEFYYIEKQNRYVLRSLTLPIIEFMIPYENDEQNFMRRGRLYYQLDYFNENRELIKKSDTFLNPADKLFKAFRRTFKNVKTDTYKGNLITANTFKLIAEIGLELKTV